MSRLDLPRSDLAVRRAGELLIWGCLGERAGAKR